MKGSCVLTLALQSGAVKPSLGFSEGSGRRFNVMMAPKLGWNLVADGEAVISAGTPRRCQAQVDRLNSFESGHLPFA